jgi:transposase
MTRLEDIDTGALREALAGATDPKAVKRLMIALAYNDGVPVETLSERYGIARSTVYFWLDRFEGGSIAGAIYDDHRSGRPPSLDEREREHLNRVLQRRPEDVGFEQTFWTPELVQEYVQREYDVSYSLGHIRRFLRN